VTLFRERNARFLRGIRRSLVCFSLILCMEGCTQIMGNSDSSPGTTSQSTSATASLASGNANSDLEIIAHRGASHDAPENTLAAVNLAWTQGADAVEVDVYLSADQRIVAVHDKTLKRYGGPDKPIAKMTWEELQKYEVGAWKDKKYAGEPIPLLSDILKTIPGGKRVFIEIKCGPEIIPHLSKVLSAAQLDSKQTAIICFSEEVIAASARQLPQIKRYWLASLKRNKVTRKVTPTLSQLIETAKQIDADGLDLGGELSVIDGEFVQTLKDNSLPLYIWTVNSVKDATRLQKAGVRGITTDRPALLLPLRERPADQEPPQ